MKLLKGYSIIELMTVLSILFLTLALAVPSLQTLVNKHLAKTTTDQLFYAINRTRSEALLRQTTVTLCASKDGLSCAGPWSDGLLLFIAHDGSHQYQAGDLKLQTWSVATGKISIRWNRASNYLQFSRSGYLQSQLGEFVICAKGKSEGFNITLSTTGRARMSENINCE